MKNLLDIIPSNLSSALGWTLVHSAWQGVIILLIFSILYQFYKQNSALKYWLGIGALSLQVLASVITFLWIFEPNPTGTFTKNLNVNLSVLNNSTTFQTVQNRDISWLENAQMFFNSHVDLLVNIWMLGVIFLTLKLMGGFIYVQNLKSKRTYFLDDATEKIFKNLIKKAQIKQHVYLFESSLAKIPMTIGYFEAVILLPMGLATGLSVKELEAVLAHELAHIRRADYLVNILQTLVEIVFFFHPAIWYISAKIREERENCCDDLAMEMVGDKIHLAKALTNVELFRQRESLAMAFGGNKQNLLSRVQRILGVNSSKTRSYEGFFAVMLVILASIFYVNIEEANAQEPVPPKRTVAPIAPRPPAPPKPPKNIKQTFIQGDDGTVHNYINNHEMHIQDGYIVVDGQLVKLSPEDSTKLRYHQQEMKKLQEKMQPYQDKMTKLSAEMQAYSTKMNTQMQPLGEYGNKMVDIGRKMGNIGNKQVDLEIKLAFSKEGSKERKQLEKQLAELKTQNDVLEKQMNFYEKQMEEVEVKMEIVEAPMEKLSQEMEEQGKYMEEIGKEMEVHGEAIEKLIPEEVRKKFSIGRPPRPPHPPRVPRATRLPIPPVPPTPPRGDF
jgi:bla regulator protein blaR1